MIKWKKMYYRYYYNWHHERFDYNTSGHTENPMKQQSLQEKLFHLNNRAQAFIYKTFAPIIRFVARSLYPFSYVINPFITAVQPLSRPFFNFIGRVTSPIAERMSKRKIQFTINADPYIFDEGKEQ